MNPAAEKGRRAILIVSAALILPAAAMVLLSPPPRGLLLVRFAIATAMSLLMWRGYSWARSWVAVGLGLAGLITAATGIVVALRVWWGFPFLALPPLYFWGAWTLWRSPAVEAYIEHCERRRDPELSFSSTERD